MDQEGPGGDAEPEHGGENGKAKEKQCRPGPSRAHLARHRLRVDRSLFVHAYPPSWQWLRAKRTMRVGTTFGPAAVRVGAVRRPMTAERGMSGIVPARAGMW